MADLVTELALGDLPAPADLGFGDLVRDTALVRARGSGDPLADDVVARLARRRPIGPGDDVLSEVRLLAEVEGGVFRELLEACCYVPAWADFAAMEPGLHLIARAAPLATPAPPIEPTPRPHPAQELAERLTATGTDLLLLPLPGEVQPGGRHHAIATRLRLVHATTRWSLLKGGYGPTRQGVPVNQEHLAAALAMFAYLTVAGMARMGVPVSNDEIASTGLLWRWIGHVLGVDDDLVHLDAGDRVARFRGLMDHEAERAQHAGGALDVLGGALTALPGPLASVARGLGQRRPPAAGTAARAPRARRVAAPGLGFTLRVPGGATVMQRVGTAMIEARYASASAAAYGASGPGGPVDAAGTLHVRHPTAAAR